MTNQLEALIAEMKAAANRNSDNFEPVTEVRTKDLLRLIAALKQAQQDNEDLKRDEVLSTELARGCGEGRRRLEQLNIELRKCIAELESTLEREREKSRRVMSRNHQLEAGLSVLIPAMEAGKVRRALRAAGITVQGDE